MSGSPAWSGRRSGRVEAAGPLSDVGSGAGSVSAPEGLVSAVSSVSPERRARRVSGSQLTDLQHVLSERDHAVLASLYQHPFLTSRQLQLLHFHDHATEDAAARICRRVLGRLHHLLIIEHLERRIGGVRAGSASFVWRVGLIGDRLLRHASNEPGRARRKEPSLRHLDHCLAVADCHLALITAARAHQLELLRVATEPACWRHYLGVGGAREVLKPDLYAVTATGEYEDHWFIELDRATESLPTLLRKCAQYEAYRRTGHEQDSAGVFPLVIWIVPDEQRAAKLRAAIVATRGLDTALFRVTIPRHFVALARGSAA